MRQVTLTIWFLLAAVVPATAQSPSAAAPAVEVHGGWAGFLDDSTSHHGLIGGAARWRLTDRLTVGPEVTYMRGPGTDRDVFVQGAVTWDLRGRRGTTGATPYLVIAGGLMAHSSGFGPDTWSSEGAIGGGAGVRIDVTPRFFVAPEIRVGWEPHTRITVAGGWRF